MKLDGFKAINEFTGTPGAVSGVSLQILKIQELKNINVNGIDGVQNGIRSFEEYLIYYSNGDKRGKTRLYNRIIKLKEILFDIYGYNIDPIHYIIKLYYIDKFSIVDVGKKLNELGWGNDNESSIEKTFKQTFGWELRDNLGTNISRRKRNFGEQIKNAQEITDEKNEKKYKILKDFFGKRVEGILEIKIGEFDYEGFEKLNKVGKILYILYFFYGINRNEILELRKSDIGARVIANFINENIEILLEKLDVKLNIFPKDIQSILTDLN